MKGIKVLQDSELLDEVSMDNLKGGQASESNSCCRQNTACNVNSKELEEQSNQ